MANTSSKPIIVICGANHSGTSMVTKLLLDNGGWTGELEAGGLYPQYEDEDFKRFSTDMMGMTGGDGEGLRKKELPDKVVVFKYPSSYMTLGMLKNVFDRKMKVMYVVRNPSAVIKSTMDKTGNSSNTTFQVICSAHQFVANFDGEVKVVMFERLLQGKDVKELLSYCGLKPKEIDMTAIKPKMVRH